MIESARQTKNSVYQLLVIAALRVIGYTCVCTMSFAVPMLNFIFVCAFLTIPLLAIRPVLRLPHWRKLIGQILLIPLLAISSCSLLFQVACDRPGTSTERMELLQTLQQGNSIIRLFRYENGGAVGIQGVELEQWRLIVPGLYLVRSLDIFDYAMRGTLSAEGPDKMRVVAKGSYDRNDYETNQVYTLKPWVYF
jgi:hypothetical protein